VDYNVFQDMVIGVYGDLDRRGNAKDYIRKFLQTGLVVAYISMFNEYATQIDWNESSLVVCFQGRLKDEILDLVATTETQPWRLHEWMVIALQINERLWGRHQNWCPQSNP